MTGSYHSVCVCVCVSFIHFLTIQIFFFNHKPIRTTSLPLWSFLSGAFVMKGCWFIRQRADFVHSSVQTYLKCDPAYAYWHEDLWKVWRTCLSHASWKCKRCWQPEHKTVAGTRFGGVFFFHPQCLYFVPLLEALWCQSHLNQMKTWIFHIN